MSVRPVSVVIGTISLALLLLPGLAQAEPVDDAAAQCKALGSVDFSHIPDAPAQIIEAKVVKDNGDAHEFCEINGYVEPSVGFLLRLPLDSWNGKFMEFGCGGFCGSTEHIQKCNDPLRRGYACIVSDAGHRSTALDGKWAYNNPQAQIDFGYRSTHVTALVGKAITERFYGRAPDHSYFHGCSTGGRQGLMEAQRFPWDFDGVIAGAPVVSGPAIGMSLLWTSLALRDKTGEPLLRQIDLEVLHDAVVAKCDLNDGVKDGLIGDPRACSFDPSVLLCNESKKTRCLSAKQVSAVSKIYGSPVTSKGEAIYAPGVLPGSERTWLDWDPRALIADAFRYFYFRPAPGPSWNVGDFNFDRDYKRLGMGEVGTAADNPDLRKYKAAGGKLLSYMGWSDSGVTPLAAADYYETVEKTMGGRAATQEFFRLFMIPGMNHCTGGDGAFAVNYLSYLETWVEKGQAPEKLIGFHVQTEDLMDKAMKGDQEAWHTLERRLEFPLDTTNVEFSRPIYAYPTQAKYLGHGDPKDAASFGPVQH